MRYAPEKYADREGVQNFGQETPSGRDDVEEQGLADQGSIESVCTGGRGVASMFTGQYYGKPQTTTGKTSTSDIMKLVFNICGRFE